ncbi:uncharacterized protein [Nicotiana sylvestris]|uniref:uncharacterized protein n=1 Tax=Nicotiana sylvestris TaxID=4096 RepID=UPI00388C5099
MNQLAKAQLQQVQGPKQVNSMVGVSMMVNKRRQKGPQVQNRVENYVQDDSGFDQDGKYNEQEEEEIQEEVNPSKAPIPRPPLPYPQRLAKKNGENQFKKFIDMMKILSINVSLVEALKQMPGYAKFIKDLVTKKRSMNYETIKMKHKVSEIVHSMTPKLEHLGAFITPCKIESADFAKALCDLGASINLMPYSVFKTFGIGQPRPTSMRLKMADRTMKRPLVIIDDVLVRVNKFILPADFMILDCQVDYKISKRSGPVLAQPLSLVFFQPSMTVGSQIHSFSG